VEARETNKQSTEQKFEQSGLTLAVTSGLVSNLQGAQKQQQAGSQTKDDRMKALAVANQVASVSAAAQSAQQLDVSLSIGISRSQSQQTSESDTARGSRVTASGTTTIKAIGTEQASNLTVQGSDVSGKSVNLEADNQVVFLAASNTNSQTSSSSNSSSSVGASVGTSGLGVTASAALGKGNGNGTDTTYTNTHIAGAESVTIKSGGDTTLKGATVEGKQVTATVGGSLNIESLQDTSTYKEKNQQLGGSVIVGLTDKGPVKGNINFGKSNIHSNYASVAEQSGLKAGDGGFTVNVQGNTDLVGGAITSTQAAVDNNKNSFQTGGTLTTSDIQNSASYNANSVSVTLGMGSTPGQSASAGMSGVGFGTDKGLAGSTTTVGISGIAGDSSKRTGDKQQGIAQIFNKDRVKAEVNAQTVITSEFGKNASKAVGDYAQTKLDEAKANNDQAGIDAWKEGGTNRVALHTVVGGLTGEAAGAVGAGTSQAAIDQIGEALRGADLPLEVKQALIAAAGTAMGAAASGGSVAGGATALNATANNYLYAYDGKIIARDKVDNNKVIVLSDKDKQKLAALEPAVLMKEVAGIDSDGAPVVVKDERVKDMTDSTTYNLANAKDRAKLQESTDMGYINTDDKNTRIYVQTGMQTKPEDALKNAQSLSKVVGEPVGVIVNSTQGLDKDVQEFLPKAPSIKDALNEYTYQTLNKQGDKLVVMHSAGNEDAKKALQLGQQLGHQYSNLSFVSLGSPVSNSIMRQNVTQTQAQYLGQVNDWRDPVTNPTLWVTGSAALLAGGAAAGVALAPATGGTSLYAYGSALMGGGLGGGLGGGAIVYGINNIHLMEKYIAKPQTQSIMFNWQAKQGK
jgi:filamentous hemagglutinin